MWVVMLVKQAVMCEKAKQQCASVCLSTTKAAFIVCQGVLRLTSGELSSGCCGLRTHSLSQPLSLRIHEETIYLDHFPLIT